MTQRLTTAQAIIRFLTAQFVERDGSRNAFFAGCFGIFGHGNVAGIGQALQQNPDFPYYLCRNEQAMVHTAAALRGCAQALRQAMMGLIDGPGFADDSGKTLFTYAHPLFWAPYSIIGDGGT